MPRCGNGAATCARLVLHITCRRRRLHIDQSVLSIRMLMMQCIVVVMRHVAVQCSRIAGMLAVAWLWPFLVVARRTHTKITIPQVTAAQQQQLQ